MSKLVRITGILLCLMLAAAVNAAQVADLYQADVVAEGSTTQWQQQALAQVLVRVSGKADVVTQPDIAAELKRASGYVKQFEAVRHADGNRMRVLLDAVKVNQLLQQHNIAVWGKLRPDTLIWLVQQDGAERRFVRQTEHALSIGLQQAFRQAALPLLQPLYDMDDLLNIAETDVWAGFWQQINKASQRYVADVVVAVTVAQVNTDAGPQLRLTWQRQSDGRTYRDEVTATDEAALMQAFAAGLASQLSERYASVMSATGNATLLLKVQGLHSLAELVQVQKLLQQMVGVTQVTISRYQAGLAHYAIDSSVAADSFLNALRFNKQLRPVAPAAEPGMAEPLNAAEPPVLATFEFISR